MALRKWLGWSPNGPAADPRGKESTSFRIIDSLGLMGGGVGPGGVTAGADCGCFARISSRTDLEASARLAEERA